MARGFCHPHWTRLRTHGDVQSEVPIRVRYTDRQCEVIDGTRCERLIVARGMCSHHYERNKQYGSPLGVSRNLPRLTGTPEQRFSLSVKRQDTHLLWTRSIDKVSGYGSFWDGERVVKAHRFSYVLHNGPIPPKLYVCHTCRFRHCVEPDHLYVGTAKENMADTLRDGTHNRGSRHGMSKLSEADVVQIRSSTSSRKELAVKYGVSRTTIDSIITRKAWTWL